MKAQTILTFVTILITSTFTFADGIIANEKLNCSLQIDGKPSSISVDFSTTPPDDHGFKIYSLVIKDGFDYTLQKHNKQNEFILNVGALNKNGTYSSQFLSKGVAPNIWHVSNSVWISCLKP